MTTVVRVKCTTSTPMMRLRLTYRDLRQRDVLEG